MHVYGIAGKDKFIAKKCLFTDNMSIRGRIRTGA